jgi:2-desacetyl-2-hydroxyethyl bacteriochlorophyllide A dehydrogenase
MRTLVLQEPENFQRHDTPHPGDPGPGQALVRVHRVGICGTDLHAYRGRQPFFNYPRILGHELGVEVTAVGTGVDTVSPGDLCAVEPYLNCGTCSMCQAGRTNCCESLQVLGVHTDGGMREWLLVPAEKLHASKKLQAEQLALVETLGIGAHAVERAQLRPDDRILVIGAGPIGLSVLQFAHLAQAPIAVAELDASRRAFCRDQFGIEHCLEGGVESVNEVFGGQAPTVVFDATGNPHSMRAAFDYPGNGGRMVFVGFFQGEVSFNSPDFHRRELTLLGSRNAQSQDFKHILRLMEEGRIDTAPWITHKASYNEIIEKFPHWLDPANGVVKAMLELS